MAKAGNENISALMSITKKDRESVIRALNQVWESEMLHCCLYDLHTLIYYSCFNFSLPVPFVGMYALLLEHTSKKHIDCFLKGWWRFGVGC